MTDHKFRLIEDVLYVDAEGESVLLTIGEGKYYGVRGAARHVLGTLREGSTVSYMAGLVCARFAVSRGDAIADLQATLEKLIAAGLVETLPDGS